MDNTLNYRDRVKANIEKSKQKAKVAKAIIWILSSITFLTLAIIVIQVFVEGVPNLRPEMFQWKYTTDNLSMTHAIVNTLIMVVLSLAMAAPIGILSAVYLNEYMDINSPLRRPIRLATQTLAGIPSILYGLFGNIFFVTFLGWQYSVMAGACTLAIMILPTIITSTEEALMSVADSQREASYGLGAMKLRTVFNVVLPPAIPGILSGVILAIGRIVGETAALLYTSGSATRVPNSLMSSGRTLAIHVYMLSTEGMHKGEAFATGVVLLVFVFIINALSAGLANWIGQRSQNG